MKKIWLCSVIAMAFQLISAQSVTLEECWEKARINYPFIKQYGLIENTTAYNVSNATKAYLPKLLLSAKATYQSDVTELPEALSQRLGISMEGLSKDQYQLVGEISQLMWDGGATHAQKEVVKTLSKVEKQKVEVDLYALKERVSQLYFGILLIDEQVHLNTMLKDELQTHYKRIEAYKQNGVANQSDLDAIQVEQLNVEQRNTELVNTKLAYVRMLSIFTKMELDEKVTLSKPEKNLLILGDTTNNRPELTLLAYQSEYYESQKKIIHANNLPKLSAFFQGGYGKPALNMFANEFAPFYIGGIRFSWNLGELYSTKNNTSKLDINKQSIDVQKETFLFNMDLKNEQDKLAIKNLQALLNTDDDIIRLRENIKKVAVSKVENGTLTVADLIREINAENQAKQLKSLHEIQLIKRLYEVKNNINK